MTTTPDSRIAHDWHLDALPGPECSPLPPGVPSRSQAGHLVEQMTPELRAEMEAHWARAEGAIDTSTTAGKIAVMQHAAQYGAQSIECRKRTSPSRENFSRLECDTADIRWNWEFFDYRIAPPPAPRTALQAAREYTMTAPDKVNASSMARLLVALLQDIDYSPVVEVLERRISWDAADLSALPKGRYRLLRDDV